MRLLQLFSLCVLLLTIPSGAISQNRNQICTPGAYVEVYGLGVPDNGLIRADGAVPEGYRVTLRGVARKVLVGRDCSTRFRPIPFRWSVMYRPPNGRSRPLSTELTASGTLTESFTAVKGTYEVKLETSARESGSGEGKKEFELSAITCGDWLSIGPKVLVPECFKAGVCGTGMVMAVAFDPLNANHMFVGTRGGGIWESVNGGDYWRPISDHNGLPAGLVVGRLAVAPRPIGQQFGRIYAGTGSSDAIFLGKPSADGIYASDDGGSSWKLLGNRVGCSRPGTYPSGTVSKIILDPTNAARIYASASNGVFMSEDAGNCWSDLTANLRDLAKLSVVRDLLLLSVASGSPTLYASVQAKHPTTCDAVLLMVNPAQRGSLWERTDSGVIGGCKPIPSETGLIRLAKGLDPLNPGDEIVYALVPDGDALHIFRSGFLKAWVQGQDPSMNGCPVNSTGAQCQAPNGCNGCNNSQCSSYDLAIAVNPLNGCDVIVATTLGQMRSVDCGDHWQSYGDSSLTTVDPHVLSYHPTKPLLFMGHDQGLLAINAGAQPKPVEGCGAQQATPLDCSKQQFNCWDSRSNGMASDQFYGLSSSTFSTWKEGVIGGLQDNGTKLRLGGTTNWKKLFGGDGGGSAIDTHDSSVAYYGFNALTAGGGASPIFRTTTAKTPGANITSDPVVGTATRLWSDPYRRGVLLSTGIDGKLYYAADAGTVLGEPHQPTSWTCIDPTPNRQGTIVTDVDFPEENGVYYVSTIEPSLGDFRPGGIYKVIVKNFNPPVTTCTNPLDVDELAVTTIVSPDQHLGSARISIDPEHPETGLYATFQNFGAFRVCHILLDSMTGKWTINSIGAGFPGFGTTGNYWNPPTFPWYPIAADPQTKGRLYVGTENGLAEGTRNGTDDTKWSWQLHPYFPMTEVSDLSVTRGSALAHGIVRASTLGRGIWERASCPIPLKLSIPLQREPNVHVPVPPPINPFLRLTNLVLPVEYSLPANVRDGVTLRATVTQEGRPFPYVITESVPIQAGQGTRFVGIIYGRANAPIGAESDGITIQMIGRGGRVLAEEKIAFIGMWRRLDSRSLFVGAEVERTDGEAAPVNVAVSVSWIRNYERIATASTLAVPQAARVIVEAPDRIETPSGIARFRRWVGIVDEPEGTSRVNQPIFEGNTSYRRVRVSVANNIALRAIYQTEGPAGMR